MDATVDNSIIIGLLPSLAYVNKLHPLTVHFPIAFCLGYCLVELFATFIRRPQFAGSARTLIYLSVAGSVLAAVTGFIDRFSGELQPLVRYEEHRNVGLFTLCLSILIAVWRTIGAGRRPFIVELAQLLIALCLGGLVMRTSDSGMLLAHFTVADPQRSRITSEGITTQEAIEKRSLESKELELDERESGQGAGL